MATVEKVREQAEPVGLPPRLRDLVWYFLTLGTVGFGGPIATVGYMQRDLVQRKGWVSERDLLDGIALGQTMPGPLAAQVVMWVGFLSGRALGALIVAVAFVLPSFVAVLALAFLYVEYEGLGWVRAVFYGVAPGAIAIIVVAAYKLAMTTNGREAEAVGDLSGRFRCHGGDAERDRVPVRCFGGVRDAHRGAAVVLEMAPEPPLTGGRSGHFDGRSGARDAGRSRVVFLESGGIHLRQRAGDCPVSEVRRG